MIKTAQWTSPDKFEVKIVQGDGSITIIPRDLNNNDYAALVATNTPIADYILPKAPVPQNIAMWQARVALSKAALLDRANAVVAAANDPVISNFWEYATGIDRSSPTLAKIALALGQTDAQLDALFVEAASITL